MPLKGYVCPPGAPTAGERHEITHCVSACQAPCVAPPLLAAMWKADSTNYHQGAYISASMLAGSNCARQVQYERTHDFYEHPQKRYWPFRGAMAHAMCEGAQDLLEPYGWLQEFRLETALEYDLPAPIFKDGVELPSHFTGEFDYDRKLVVHVKGTTDAYNPWLRVLADMKSMADAKVDMVLKGSKGGTFSPQLQDEWVWQFNIYRWLISRTPVSPAILALGQQYGLRAIKSTHLPPPNKLWMQGIGMMHMPRSGTTYGVTQRGKTTLYPIDDIPLLAFDAIEDFVRPRALNYYRYLVLGQQAPVVRKEDDWLCVGPETPVLTPDGYREIQDILVGDYVMTRSGWRAVTATMKRPVGNKRVLRFKSYYGREILITDDHPILTTCYPNTVAQANRDGTTEWKTLADLATWEGLSPKVYLQYRTEEHELPSDITEAHLLLLGAFIADGSLIDFRQHTAGGGTYYKVSIVMHSDALERAEKLCEATAIAFPGVTATHTVRQHAGTTSRVLTIYSKEVAQFVERWVFGRKAPLKQLHNSMLTWPIWAQALIVQAAFEGDGHLGKAATRPTSSATWVYSTASEKLAVQFQEMLWRMGKLASLTCVTSKSGYSPGSKCYKVSYSENPKYTYGKFVQPGLLEVPIQYAEEVPYDGDVYDITVAEDHEFATSAAIVHNCRNCSFNGEQIPGSPCLPTTQREPT